MNVFVSYSHVDEKEFKDELEKHTASLRRNGMISTWHDRKITPGQNWKEKIDGNIKDADVILLLISSDFMHSDYCYDVEMEEAMRRHNNNEAIVVPIILRHVDWSNAPFARLQVLPEGAIPIKSWPDRDQAFTNVVDGLRKIINRRANLMELGRLSYKFNDITLLTHPNVADRVSQKEKIAEDIGNYINDKGIDIVDIAVDGNEGLAVGKIYAIRNKPNTKNKNMLFNLHKDAKQFFTKHKVLEAIENYIRSDTIEKKEYPKVADVCNAYEVNADSDLMKKISRVRRMLRSK